MFRTFSTPAWLWRTPATEILVVLIALAARAAMFTGPAIADDFAYLEHARDWVDGVYDPARETYVFAIRYGIVLPVAAAMWLLGPSSWAVSIPSLLASLVGVCCVMVVGTRLGNRPIGLLAGFAAALNPHSALFGTKILPEVFFDFPLWVSVALCVIGNDRRSGAWFFVGGLVGGYAYLVRSYGLALALAGALGVLGWRRSIGGKCLAFIAGLAMLPVAEAIYHGLTTGHPLQTMILNQRYVANMGDGDLNPSLLHYPREFWGGQSEFLRFPWLVFLALPFAWRTGAGRFGIALLGLWGGFYEFGIMSWDPFRLINKETRFLSPLVLPMALVLATALQQIWVTWRSWARLIPAGAVATLMVLDLGQVRQRVRGPKGAMEKYHVVASEIMANRPQSVAFPHLGWPLRSNYFAGFIDGYRHSAPTRPGARFRVPDARAQPLPGEWVVVDPGMFLSRDWPIDPAPLPTWLLNPPADWPVRVQVGPVRVVEVPATPVAHRDLDVPHGPE